MFKNINNHYILFFLLLFITLKSVEASQPYRSNYTDTTKRKIKNLIFPLIGRAPETNWAFGIASATIFSTKSSDTLLRTSTIPIGIIYTLKNQIIAGFGANIYFPGEKYILRLENTFSKFPDRFWGMGYNSLETNMENYAFGQFYFNPIFLRKIFKDYFAGLTYEYQSVFYMKYTEGGIFDKENILGKNGGSVSGLGYEISKDSRNNSYSPSKGVLIRLVGVAFNKRLFSNFNYLSTELDFRQYNRIFKKHVLCFQFISTVTAGDVPFRSMAVLGGNLIMRGFYSGRYRDLSMFALQTEYRFPIWWRFGAVGFAGIGQVSKKITNLHLGFLKYSIGGGLRFAIIPKEKLNIRFDYGFANGSRNFYIVLSEAF